MLRKDSTAAERKVSLTQPAAGLRILHSRILFKRREKLKVTAKITRSFEAAGRLKAFATICLADAFLVTGVRVVEGEKGLNVFMPSMKDKEDEYRDVCFPIKPELRQQINTVVLNAYDASVKENEGDEG